MKNFLAAAVLASLTSAYAQVDYSHCQHFVDETNADVQKTGFGFPFKLGPAGEVQTINHSVSYSEEKKGVHVYSAKGWAGSMKITVKKGKDSAVGSVEVERISTAPGAPPKVGSLYTFGVVNGKCVPALGSNVADINGEMVTTTIFDTNLCRKIKDYFGKNSELNKCFDPASAENQAMRELFAKQGYDSRKLSQKFGPMTPVLHRYSYSVEQKVISGTSEPFDNGGNSAKENKNILGLLGGSPLVSAHMILSDCYEKGLAPVLEDESIWSSAAPASKKS